MTKPSEYLTEQLGLPRQSLKPSKPQGSLSLPQPKPSQVQPERLGTLGSLLNGSMKPSEPSNLPTPSERLGTLGQMMTAETPETSETGTQAKPSEQLFGLIHTAEQKKKEEHDRLHAPSTGPRVRLFSRAEERVKFYRESPPIGSWDMEVMRRLILQYRDAPVSHPYMRGLVDYKKGVPETPVPFKEGSWQYWNWYAGWHQSRRDSGDLEEGDVV